jgi:hypothetical protein
MITYKWGLQCDPIVVPSEDGLTNVVKTVHWDFAGTDESGVTARCIGCTILGGPDRDAFAAFETLTLDTVMGWVHAAIGGERVNQMKEDLAQQIAFQKDQNRPRPMPLVRQEG